MRSFTIIAAAAALALPLLGCVVEPAHPVRVVYSADAPPTPMVETVPVSPGTGWAWHAGHWHWNGYRYVWIRGRYVARPAHFVAWVPGHWNHGDHGWIWIEGHWR